MKQRKEELNRAGNNVKTQRNTEGRKREGRKNKGMKKEKVNEEHIYINK